MNTPNTKSLQQLLTLRRKTQLFHHKKLELGRVKFITDDTYVNGLKIQSRFRAILVNQPGSEQQRKYFQNQLDKYSVKGDTHTFITLLMLLTCLYIIYIKPFLLKITLLVYGGSLPSLVITKFFVFLSPILGLDRADILVPTLAEGITNFSLLPL